MWICAIVQTEIILSLFTLQTSLVHTKICVVKNVHAAIFYTFKVNGDCMGLLHNKKTKSIKRTLIFHITEYNSFVWGTEIGVVNNWKRSLLHIVAPSLTAAMASVFDSWMSCRSRKQVWNQIKVSKWGFLDEIHYVKR